MTTQPPAFLRIDQGLSFPDAASASSEGLVAVGGDFSTSRLLLAYRSGIFPWTAQPITWWSPDPRAIFELADFHVPHRLAKFIRQRPFEITHNHAFGLVMRGCAQPAVGREASWVTPEFITA